jgi:16S rRNA (uracil1498-N3)-methyltransferase
VLLAVGPEGGWTNAELGVAQAHGWESLNLGPRILRVETAAVALAAIAGAL